MLNVRHVAAVFMGLFGFNVFAQSALPVDSLYVPKGFDSNDNIEIVVGGYLPTPCHGAPTSKATVSENKISISVFSHKDLFENKALCPQMIVPFMEVVNVGALPQGKYDVSIENNTVVPEARLVVDKAVTDRVDDFIYANVDLVEQVGEDTIRLKGYNPSDCFNFDEVSFVSNDSNVIAVLPKMNQVYERCPMKMVPFEIFADVPKDLLKRKSDEERLLLHVRTMHGRSKNAWFYRH